MPSTVDSSQPGSMPDADGAVKFSVEAPEFTPTTAVNPTPPSADEPMDAEAQKVHTVWKEITEGHWKREASQDLANLVESSGIRTLEKHGLLNKLRDAANDSASPTTREGAMLIIKSFCEVVGKVIEPFMVPFLPTMLELLSDKSATVRAAAEEACAAFGNMVSPSAAPLAIPVLLANMEVKSKWQTKEGALKMLHSLTDTAPQAVSAFLPEVVPAVSDCMVDAKVEVKNSAWATMNSAFQLVGNRDIEPTVPAILSCIAKPAEVPAVVIALSRTTFVQTVESPALAVMVPLLIRGLKEDNSIKRKTSVIVGNMAKLVTNPLDAALFLPRLLPRLEQVAQEASDPELRSVAQMAHQTCIKIAKEGEIMEKEAPPKRYNEEIVRQTLVEVLALHTKLVVSDMVHTVLSHVAYIAHSLMKAKVFELDEWDAKACAPYLTPFLTPTELDVATKNFLAKCDALTKDVVDDDDDDEEGVDLCNCEFSLAYGGKILLNSARLRLKRGRRYGLCGANGAGKSTLMRAINSGKLDGFPSKEQLVTAYVEHDIDSSLSEMAVADFVLQDERLTSMKQPPNREEVETMLGSVGFSEVMRKSPLVSLSGGWKMKLALARAMLMKPDIMLLDEPTNHLDVTNVAWLEDYLNKLQEVTVMVVSHDSGFLDNVCTHIVHYNERKLKVYRGNLSEFVKAVPSAKSYYELTAAQLKFNFPVPGFLDGVNTDEKPILQMKKVTFTYPGRDKAQLTDVTCHCRLGSRVAILGVNGAGKSTLIKILTGELRPTTGTVMKHPNVRVAYVAQHAFHHIEEHLDKTPNQYIRRRFQAGEDSEESEKVTRKMSKDEEEKIMKQVWVIDGQNRVLDKLLGRRKKKRSFEYEVKWVGLSSLSFNRWISREELEERGFIKLINEMDGKIAAAAGGVDTRPLTQISIEAYLQDFGLDPEFGTHSYIRGLSGGQKVKLVLAAAMWNNPHLLVLDEPTNYLDRESLGALAQAIKEFKGGVIVISHHAEFTSSVSNEAWHLAAGKLTAYKGEMTAEMHASLVNTGQLPAGAGASA